MAPVVTKMIIPGIVKCPTVLVIAGSFAVLVRVFISPALRLANFIVHCFPMAMMLGIGQARAARPAKNSMPYLIMATLTAPIYGSWVGMAPKAFRITIL